MTRVKIQGELRIRFTQAETNTVQVLYIPSETGELFVVNQFMGEEAEHKATQYILYLKNQGDISVTQLIIFTHSFVIWNVKNQEQTPVGVVDAQAIKVVQLNEDYLKANPLAFAKLPKRSEW